ncbi:MAG: alpha/beta fold hydrolase [Promethearchaeota archaeon]|nr:MAG: alpha/beta fold hydrolase [Candidatus Lokiarchaeota archaeon]
MEKELFIDDPSISNVVFYPRKTSIPNDLPKNFKVLNFQINKDIVIGGYYFLQDEDLPSILLFHGNGEVALEYNYFIDLFFKCGVNLAVADFRGYGHSTGRPTYSSLIMDAFPIYNEFKKWIDENGMSTSLFIQGRSLGSVCASEIGSHNPKDVRGIIFESGFGSIYNMMTRLFRVQIPDELSETILKYSNDTRIKKFQKPTLVIHGTMDWIIPKEEANVIYDAIPEEVEKKLIMIEGAGHNNIFSFENEYFEPLKEFINKNK